MIPLKWLLKSTISGLLVYLLVKNIMSRLKLPIFSSKIVYSVAGNVVALMFDFLFFFFSFIFISWKLITLQYCRDFCHILTLISHGFTCVPHPIPLGLPGAPALSTCLMHPAWAGDFLSTHACTLSLCHGWLFETPWTVVCQVPLFMGFSGQEYSSSIFILQGDLSSDPGIESASPVSPVLAGSFFTPEPLGSLPHL